jgi:murein DD-endopeptidase MepM/ murein hydrolase activator NlpD
MLLNQVESAALSKAYKNLMLPDYKLPTTTGNGRDKRMRRRLLLSAPLLVLGVSGLYAAFASGESPLPSENEGFAPSPSPVTIPLALPEPPEAAAADLPQEPSSPPADLDSRAQITVVSVATKPLQPVLPAQSIPEIETAAVDAGTLEVSDELEDTGLTDTEHLLAATVPEENWLTHDIKSGDTLARIFSDLGLSPRQLHGIVNSSKSAKRLAQIKPGQKIRIRLGTDNEIQTLVHEISPIRSRQAVAKEDGFETRILDRPLEHRNTHAYGMISTSLFASAQKAGLSDSKTMELANIFGWDIDFALEIRAGDQFTVVYQEDYLDGQKLRDGPILAAEFVNNGKTYRAVRYVDSDGHADYFTPEGKSVRKAFLRTPVKLARIVCGQRRACGLFHPGGKECT